MTDQQLIIEAAKLDGYTPYFRNAEVYKFVREDIGFIWMDTFMYQHNYLTSHDAIISVIKKQYLHDSTLLGRMYKILCNDAGLEAPEIWIQSTPKQLCIALVKATGKWTEE